MVGVSPRHAIKQMAAIEILPMVKSKNTDFLLTYTKQYQRYKGQNMSKHATPYKITYIFVSITFVLRIQFKMLRLYADINKSISIFNLYVHTILSYFNISLIIPAENYIYPIYCHTSVVALKSQHIQLFLPDVTHSVTVVYFVPPVGFLYSAIVFLYLIGCFCQVCCHLPVSREHPGCQTNLISIVK